MTPKPIIFRVPHLPDPADTVNRLIAGGDVREAVQEDDEHLPRTVADSPPGSALVKILLHYMPAAAGQDLRQRLSIFLMGQAHQAEAEDGLSALLGQGPFRRFYDLREHRGEVPVRWDQFHAACDVTRRQALLDPIVSPEFNADALVALYTIQPFQARPNNDYLRLDRILSTLKEPVLLDVSIEPVDGSQELGRHTRYLSLLQRVNRTWDSDEDDLADWDWDDRDSGLRLPSRTLKPLKVKDPQVDEVLRSAQRFHETLSMPQLLFHIRVLAQSPAIARLAASVAAESAFEGGRYQLFDSARGDGFFESVLPGHDPLHVVPPPALKRLMGRRDLRVYDGLSRLASLATVDELTGAFRLPLASHGSPCCIRKSTDPPAADQRDWIIFGHDAQVDVCEPVDVSHQVPRGILHACLPKGTFIDGMTGTGKTTSMVGMLIQLARRKTPFLVLEPAKTEYRIIKCLKQHPDPEIRQLAKDLQVYTMGNESISPLRINPLIRPQGISLDEHIENVAMCFDAAFPMEGPMRMILKEALEEVYENRSDAAPKMADLVAAAQRVLASKRYSGEVDSNLRAALGLRLGSLTRGANGRIFGCGQDVPTIPQLLTGRSIIELHFPPGQASLATLFVLTRIREEIRVTPWFGQGVRFVLVLEEAHNLVGREKDSSASEENADPKAHASDFICRMLVEFRAFGVGMVIVDQFGSAVAPEVTKSTASKVTFQQVTKDEREDVGDMMLCGPMEKEELARLRTGEAFIITEGYFGPRRIRTPNLHSDLGLPRLPMCEEILPYLVDDPWFVQAATNRISAEMNQVRIEMDKFEDVRMQVISEAKALMAERPGILARTSPAERLSGLASLAKKARILRNRLETAFKAFCRYGYRPAMCECPKGTPIDDGVRALRDDLAHRFDKVVSPGTDDVLQKLDDLIRECQKPLIARGG